MAHKTIEYRDSGRDLATDVMAALAYNDDEQIRFIEALSRDEHMGKLLNLMMMLPRRAVFA